MPQPRPRLQNKCRIPHGCPSRKVNFRGGFFFKQPKTSNLGWGTSCMTLRGSNLTSGTSNLTSRASKMTYYRVKFDAGNVMHDDNKVKFDVRHVKFDAFLPFLPFLKVYLCPKKPLPKFKTLAKVKSER